LYWATRRLFQHLAAQCGRHHTCLRIFGLQFDSMHIQCLPRTNGIGPVIFSLGKWLQIENKEHSEFGHLFQAIEFRQNSQVLV
jgi:hypothetical protein